MRRALVAGNWKMNKTIAEARALAHEVARSVTEEDLTGIDVVLGPPYLALPAVADTLEGSTIGVAGQDCCHHSDGAYTGEVSVSMLRYAGATHVILGHSERREMGEDDVLIARKAAASVDGLIPIICLGESLSTREAGETLTHIAYQVEHSIQGAFDSPPVGGFVIAYEPIWAIGTGLTATPDQAQQAHAFIREQLENIFGLECAQETRILYGGSVKPDNASDLFAQPDIDGGLIGGASLKSEDFLEIIRAARIYSEST